MATDSTLATFRIDKNKWESFKFKAGNASQILNRFIDSYLSGDETLPTIPESVLVEPSNLEARIDSLEFRLDDIANLDKRIENIEPHLDDIANLDKRIDKSLDGIKEKLRDDLVVEINELVKNEVTRQAGVALGESPA
jgi:hypothetical protein